MLPGVMKGKKFVSGVSRKDFESFRRLQEVPSLAEKVAKKTHAYTYNDDQRIQTDEEGNVILEMKTRELEFQIHLPSCPCTQGEPRVIPRPLTCLLSTR